MRPTLIVVLAVAGCSTKETERKPPPEAAKADTANGEPAKAAAPKPITDGEQVCDLLLPSEVEAELHQPITAHRLPQAGEYGAPRCAWEAAATDAGPPSGVDIVLFFHPDSTDALEMFEKKLVCPPGARKDLTGLGDAAVLCGGFWIRKGNNFFSIAVRGTDQTLPWRDIVDRLARRALDRLP